VTVTLELHGLEVVGRHGVEDEERVSERPFLYDLFLDVGDAALSDRIEDAIDYREVAACVREVSDRRSYHLIEALAAAVADELVARFALAWVRVRVRKPGLVVAGLQLAESVAVIERAR
jgi:dihydroneopterin aldolase